MGVTTLVKRPGEIRTGAWDYKNFPEISGGDALASVSSITSTPAGLTVGAGSILGTQVLALLTGGTEGTVYTVTATAVTVAGKTLQIPGSLIVTSG